MSDGARGLFPWEEEQDGQDAAELPTAPETGERQVAGDAESAAAAEAPAASPGAPGASGASGAPGAARTADRPRRPEPGQRPLVRKEYYSISEVADIVGLPAHVLRYWESQFSVLNPSKNRSGNRVYQRKEIKLILLVKQLLHDEKYTVEGAKQKLEQLRRGGGMGTASQRALDDQLLDGLREELLAFRQLLRAETT
jgi:DNA-binding transcriptional MerR regulator